MNPFMMMFGPMGFMGGGCGCGVNMPYYGQNDMLTFMNFPVFRNTSNDYLLDPRLAMMQAQQSWQNGGSIFGNTCLPLFNNFPGMNMGPFSPWWNPSNNNNNNSNNSSDTPEVAEKKEKLENLKNLFSKFKASTDSTSKDFKALEREYEAALKEEKLEDKITKLEAVFAKITPKALRKVTLTMDNNSSKLYRIGYNFGSQNMVHDSREGEMNWNEYLNNLKNSIEASDWTSVGAFGGILNDKNRSERKNILQIISTWNDTYNSDSDKGILRKLAKHITNDNNQQQLKPAVIGLTSALVDEATRFAEENGGMAKFPKLNKLVTNVNAKLKPINEVDLATSKIKASQITALATEFDKLYANLRVLEAKALNREIKEKYAKDMNTLKEGVIPEDIIIKETYSDLKAEKISIPSDGEVDSLPDKTSDITINEGVVDADKEYEGQPQKILDEHLVDKKHILTKITGTNVYHTGAYEGDDKGVKYYTVSDNKLVECDKDGKVAENAKEVKASDIEKYDENIKSIKSMIDRDAIKPCDDFPAAKLPYPVFKSTVGNEYYALIGDKLGKIKNCKGLTPNNEAHTVHASGTNKTLDKLTENDLETFDTNSVKSQKEVDEEKKAKEEKEKQDKINKRVSNITKEKYAFRTINNHLEELGLEQIGVKGYYKTKAAPVLFFKYNKTTQKFEHLKNVSAINQDGTMVVSGKRQYCREVEEVNESAKVLQNTLQEYQYKNNKSEKEASRDLNTVKRKFNSFKTYAQIKDIVGFIEAYNDEGKHWYTFQDDPKLCSAIARNQIIPDADKKDYIKFIATRILQIIDTKKLTLDNTDDRVTLEHIKKGKMVEYNYNQSGFNLSTTASELDRIIDLVLEKYHSKD